MPLCSESKCCFSEEKKSKDSPWSWLVLFGASMNLGFTVGLIFSFGVLLPVFMEDFKTSTERVGETHSYILHFI